MFTLDTPTWILEHGNVIGLGSDRHGILSALGIVGNGEDGHHLVTSLAERLVHRAGEDGLTDQGDFHCCWFVVNWTKTEGEGDDNQLGATSWDELLRREW